MRHTRRRQRSDRPLAFSSWKRLSAKVDPRYRHSAHAQFACTCGGPSPPLRKLQTPCNVKRYSPIGRPHETPVEVLDELVRAARSLHTRYARREREPPDELGACVTLAHLAERNRAVQLGELVALGREEQKVVSIARRR